jgi:hypothetical protein
VVRRQRAVNGDAERDGDRATKADMGKLMIIALFQPRRRAMTSDPRGAPGPVSYPLSVAGFKNEVPRRFENSVSKVR